METRLGVHRSRGWGQRVLAGAARIAAPPALVAMALLSTSMVTPQLLAQTLPTSTDDADVAAWCLERDELDLGSEGVVSGRVEADGRPLPGVELAAIPDRVFGRSRPGVSGRASAEGRFVLCGVPEGRVSLIAQASGWTFELATPRVRRGSVHRVDLTAKPSDPDQGRGDIFGLLVDRESGQPIAAASVRVGLTSTTTRDDGSFVLQDLESGASIVQVDHIGYAAAVELLDIAEGGVTRADIELVPEAIALQGIDVAVSNSLLDQDRRGLERRRLLGAGIHFDRRAIEELGSFDAVPILQASGLRFFRDPRDPEHRVMVTSRNRTCAPEIWVDGRFRFDGQEWLHILGSGELEAVEVYRGQWVPSDFIDPLHSRGCVVVAMWTRRGAND